MRLDLSTIAPDLFTSALLASAEPGTASIKIRPQTPDTLILHPTRRHLIVGLGKDRNIQRKTKDTPVCSYYWSLAVIGIARDILLVDFAK